MKKKQQVPKASRLWVPGMVSLASKRFDDKTKYHRKGRKPRDDSRDDG